MQSTQYNLTNMGRYFSSECKSLQYTIENDEICQYSSRTHLFIYSKPKKISTDLKPQAKLKTPQLTRERERERERERKKNYSFLHLT